jgi:hypothetical protein
MVDRLWRDDSNSPAAQRAHVCAAQPGQSACPIDSGSRAVASPAGISPSPSTKHRRGTKSQSLAESHDPVANRPQQYDGVVGTVISRFKARQFDYGAEVML